MDILSKATNGYVSDNWDVSDFEYKAAPIWDQGPATNRSFNIDYRLRVLEKWADKYEVVDSYVYCLITEKIVRIKTAIRQGKLIK